MPPAACLAFTHDRTREPTSSPSAPDDLDLPVPQRQVLLLYRTGSSAIPNSWVGVGGHIEPDEIRNPTASVLRELAEEVGVREHNIDDLTLRYLAVRDTGDELRSNYYFTAALAADVVLPEACDEGELRWFDLDPTTTAGLDMPATATAALRHWITHGRHDGLVRLIALTHDGPQVLPLAVG